MLSDETIEKLTATHGRIKYVVYNGVDLVFRKPKRTECQAFMMKREEGGASKIAADEQLAQQLIVRVGDIAELLPVRAAFLALLEEWPLLVSEKSVGNALGQLAGIIQSDELKSVGSPTSANPTPQTATQPG